MAFDELYLRLAVFQRFEDEDFPIHVQGLTGKVFALYQVETAGDVGMSCPSVEVVERLLVPCGILAGGLRHDAISDGVQSHAAYNLAQEPAVLYEVAAAAYQLGADTGGKVERCILRSAARHACPARRTISPLKD